MHVSAGCGDEMGLRMAGVKSLVHACEQSAAGYLQVQLAPKGVYVYATPSLGPPWEGSLQNIAM